MKTMLHEVRRGVLVSVQGDVQPSDADWDDYLATVATTPQITAFLICADNHGPDARQRARLESNRAVYPLPKAVVTTSMAVRGIVTATSWLGTNIRAFSPNNIDDAFGYLAISEPLRTPLLECVALLKTKLAGGQTLEQYRAPLDANTSDLALVHRIVEERVANIRAKLRTGHRSR